MINVSVIIPCRNEEQYIEKCLLSIVNFDYPKREIEVLVCDGMSIDRTREIVENYKKKFPDIKLINNPSKTVPQALNIGIKESSGRIIVRLDAHSVYPSNYISKLVYHLELLNADNVGGVWNTLPANNSNIAVSISCGTSHIFGIGNALYKLNPKVIKQVDTVPYGCYRRELFEKIGLFDEELIRNQDDEFNARIINNGGKIFLIPDLKIDYYARENLWKMAKMFYQYGLYKPLVNLKLKKPATVRQFIPFFFIIFLFILMPISFLSSKILSNLSLIICGFYVLINFIFSIQLTVKSKRIILIFLLPVTFITIHLSYGVGYLIGIFKFYITRKFLCINIKK